MRRRPALLAAVAAATAFFSLAVDARSQVVVYQLDFKHVDGFNVDFFEGGFFVAPALGGTGTFILTAREDGRKVLTSSAGSGNFFPGFDEHGKRISVVSATNGASSGGTIASYVAMGEVNGTVTINTSEAILKVRIAKELKGMAIAAGDESNTTTSTSASTTPTDTTTTDTTTTTTDTTTSTTDTSTTTSTASTTTSGSSSQRDIGFADISEMTLNFDTTRTERANDKEQSVDEAAAELVTLLKQKGYVEEGSTATSTDTTTTPDTGTGTTIDTGTGATTTTDTTTSG